MAILWCDNFTGAVATSDLTDRYSQALAAASITAGPFTGMSAHRVTSPTVTSTAYTMTSRAFKQLGSPRIFCGFWIRGSSTNKPTTAGSSILRLTNSIGSHLSLVVSASGSIYFPEFSGSTQSANTNISSISVLDDQWHWVEFAYEVATTGTAANGYAVLYIDGELQFSHTAIDNLGVTSETRDWRTVAVGVVTYSSGTWTTNGYVEHSGLVIWDDSVGADAGDLRAANFPLGPCRIDTLYPTAAGSSTQFTPNSGLNYAAVDDVATDFDTTYVESSTVGHVDLYAHGDLAVTPQSIKAVVVETYARNAGTGTANARAKVKSGVSTVNGDTYALTASHQPRLTGFGLDPATGAAWTKAGLDAAEFGFEFVS